MAWWKHLRGKPFYHLFDDRHPPARLFMLERMISREKGTPTQAEAALALREWGVVRHLRRIQHPDGWWGHEHMLWTPRYTATLWRLRLLAEFAVPGDDEDIVTGVDFLLDRAPASDADADNATDDTGEVPTNLNAIVAYVPLAFGFYRDERVQRRLDALIRAILDDATPDEIAPRADWLAQAAATLALAPEPDVDAVSQLAERLLVLSPAELPDRWHRFGAPIFDTPDLLVATRSLIELGVRDERLAPWVEAIVKKQRDDEKGGLYLEENRYAPAGLGVEAEGEFSHWLTAQALFVMREWYGE